MAISSCFISVASSSIILRRVLRLRPYWGVGRRDPGRSGDIANYLLSWPFSM